MERRLVGYANPIAWLLKVISGLALLILLSMHLLATHTSLSLIRITNEMFYATLLIFVLIHISTALRDVLIELSLKRMAVWAVIIAILLIAIPHFGFAGFPA